MGQPLLFNLRAVVSPFHYSLKFPTPYGVGEIKGNRKLAKMCQRTARSQTHHNNRPPLATCMMFNLGPLDSHVKTKGGEPVEELDMVSVCGSDPTKEL